MRSLIVDGDPSVARSLRRHLSGRGWDAHEIHTVSKALELFRRGCYDLVFCDADLPDGNGIALAGSLRKSCPKLRVVLTSGDPDNRACAREAGFRLFLEKPFTADVFDALLDSLDNRRVLIVEDDLIQLEEYRRVLEDAGYWTVAVDNAEAAVVLAEQARFDAILTDNVLPGMTGLQALAQLRKSGSPVIVMSSQSGPEVEKDALFLGAMAFLKKPLVPRELCRAIQQACAEFPAAGFLK
ncbi:MAG: response regulator [Elusimicrobiota bacterium]|nr:response regulator [Elusimicrobiota bacterium]